jgi:hypothetical protein
MKRIMASVDNPGIGVTEQRSFSDSARGPAWSDPSKPSAFFGTFSD